MSEREAWAIANDLSAQVKALEEQLGHLAAERDEALAAFQKQRALCSHEHFTWRHFVMGAATWVLVLWLLRLSGCS